jgi:hypothetical protein
MKRKIIGTIKYEVYIYRPKSARYGIKGTKNRFVYRQSGRIQGYNEDNKMVFNRPFINLGEMSSIINEHSKKIIVKDFKEQGRW